VGLKNFGTEFSKPASLVIFFEPSLLSPGPPVGAGLSIFQDVLLV
jgi:hypothetical protein